MNHKVLLQIAIKLLRDFDAKIFLAI